MEKEKKKPVKSERLSGWKKKWQEKRNKNPYYSIWVSLGAALVLVLQLAILWSLFVAGPARIHDEKLAQATARMVEQVPGLEGIDQTTFDYITYQGYTTDTLYWFDVTGELITSRPIQSLDFNKARETAASTYGVEAETVQLVYGYTAPAYEVVGKDRYMLLDYDSLALIYERRDVA